MSNYSDEERSKIPLIKSTLDTLNQLFSLDFNSVLSSVESGTPLDNQTANGSLDALVEKVGKDLLLKYLGEAIDYQKKSENIAYEVNLNTLFKGERGKCFIDDDPSTAWGHYKALLENSNFSNIEELKASSKNVIEMMKKATKVNEPVCGQVIGNVQSGKTAHMEALISMAADNGWNFFVVLTGLTDNLMEQTMNRMLGDLRPSENDLDDPLRFRWHYLNPRKGASDFLIKNDISLHFGDCYIYHAEKNPSQLSNVISSLNKIPQKNKVHLIVIDDESDQASVDSSKPSSFDRSTINRLILYLVENKSPEGKPYGNSFGSVNYIGYTATPYANLLNESTGLYPKDFITSLNPSSLYMGLKQFYGDGQDEGLGTHVTIIDNDIAKIISKKKSDLPLIIPDSLKDSIAWFYCCVATLKHWNFGKPVSMLINVDVKTVEHKRMNDSVMSYILNERDDLIQRCSDVYKVQTESLPKTKFQSILPEYGEGIDGLVIRDYPDYSVIEPIIRRLVSNGLTHIKEIREGSDKKHIYTPDTIHDCVDNGKGKNIDLESLDYEYTSRIIYPTKKNHPDVLKQTPAFIVIGGQTLSRGLTLEGLVSTYYIRKTTTADTLLQMARWFGFRVGYELLPRIWMDETTYKTFCDLSIINDSLFREIRRYQSEGLDPNDYYARIRDVPATGMLKSLTSPSKSKQMIKTYKNGGFVAKDKYFTRFYNVKESLQSNIESTERLLESCGRTPEQSPTGSSLIFRNVDFRLVESYLNSLVRPKDGEENNINSFGSFLDWLSKYDKSTLEYCNIVLYGTEKESRDLIKPTRTFCGKYDIHMVQRDYIDHDGEVLTFKTVRDKKSLLLDLDMKKCEEILKDDPVRLESLRKGSPDERCRIREQLNMQKTATLVITTIGRDRQNGYVEDIVSPTIFLPKQVKSDYDFERSPYVHMRSI